MIAHAEPLITAFSKIVGEAHIQQADDGHTIDGVQPQLVVEPGTADEVAAVLQLANNHQLKVMPRGGGTKQAWGNPPKRADLVLSTKRLDQVLEHAAGDMTATVQTGCRVTRFQEALAAQNQRLALDPLWPDTATIGGILATNDSGSLRIRFGSLRDLIIGITIALPDGTIARSGGKVVKNVAGYDLPKLMTGALGTLGVIVDATFRLYPQPQSTATVTMQANSPQAANAALLRILDSTLVPTGVQCLLHSSMEPRIDVRFEGESVAMTTQVEQLKHIVAGDAQVTVEDQPWPQPESLWRAGTSSAVCKLAVLPTHIGTVAAMLQRIAKPLRLQWELLAQAIGIGLLRLDAPNQEALLTTINLLRAEIVTLEGSLVVLDCPREVKARIDVWGSAGSALPLMRRVRDQFDPKQTLNSERYLRF